MGDFSPCLHKKRESSGPTDVHAGRYLPLSDSSRRFIWPACGMLKPIIASPEAAEGFGEGEAGRIGGDWRSGKDDAEGKCNLGRWGTRGGPKN